MDSSSVNQEKTRKSSERINKRKFNRKESLIWRTFGMNRVSWRSLPVTERKAFRVAWAAMQEETHTTKPSWTPGYVYVLRHPRYADLCKIGETINPANRLTQYNSSDPFAEFRYHYMIRVEDTRSLAFAFYDLYADLRLHGEWYDLHPNDAVKNLKRLRETLCS